MQEEFDIGLPTMTTARNVWLERLSAASAFLVLSILALVGYAWQGVAAAASLLSIPLVVGAYRRLRVKRLLRNPVRREIIRYLRDKDGVHLTEVAKALDVTRQTVTYHAHVLASFGMVDLESDGPYVRVFLNAKPGTSPNRPAALMRRAWARRVLDLLSDEPELNVKDLATRLGVSESTVRWYLGKLRAANLLEESNPIERPSVPNWVESKMAVDSA